MSAVSGFTYICEQCLGPQYLTDEQAEMYRDRDGWLRICCDDCYIAARPRDNEATRIEALQTAASAEVQP